MSKKLSLLLLAMGVVLSVCRVAFSQPANLYTFPGPDVDLGPSYLGRVVSGGHYIGGRGDTVYVLREYGHTYCHKSTDGGQTFGSGVRVNSTAGAYNASLKVDSAGVVYIAYQSDDADIYFTESIDGGQTFAAGIKVNDDTIPQTGQEQPVIAVNKKRQIFIAWRDQRKSAPQTHQTVFASASYDSGITFTSNVQVNDSTTPMGDGIDLDADDEHVYIVWKPYQGQIRFSISDDSGLTFFFRTFVNDLSTDSFFSGGTRPSLAVCEDFVGVAWRDLRNNHLSTRFSISTDLGQTFSPSVVVDSSSENLQPPSLFCKSGIFYCAWRATHQRTPTGPNLDHMWFSYSQDSGKTFVPYVDAVPDDTNFVPHFNPSIFVNENRRIFVAWTDARWDPLFQENHHLFVSVGAPLVAKGDLNMDGSITIADIVLELNAVFLDSPFPAPFEIADGNCDENLTAADISLLLLAAFLSMPFPCS